MTNILYTTIDAIRSTVGLDDSDLSDQMVLDQNLPYQMLERLEEILPTYEDIYDATDAGLRRLTLWCQYFGALQLLENTALGIPQRFQSGPDSVTRYTVDWEVLKADLRRKLFKLENTLAPPAVTTHFSLMGKSAAGYDPVTGA